MAGILTLIKNSVAVYTPSCEHGHNLLVSETFLGLGAWPRADVEEFIRRLSGAAGIIDATGCVAVPGLVDMHTHVCGGGGEAGVPLLMHTCCALPKFLVCSLQASVRPAKFVQCVQ